jgi:FkbM family methyltransferase
MIKARSIARRTGIKRLYYRFSPSGDYEEKFHRAISDELHSGDVVWDIGANLGFYSKIFAEKTGETGRVFTFEPVPATFRELCRRTEQYPWVHNEQIALSDFDGSSLLRVAESDTVGHLQCAGEATPENSIEVAVTRGDSYWASSGITPNLLKIDVEGFEEEVLAGMNGLLSAPELRAIFLEVHFQILEQRGRSEAPVLIEKLLRSKDFHPRWVDGSHIVAKRRPA